MVTKGDRLVAEEWAGVWDGNVKLSCDNPCITISVIKFIFLKKNTVLKLKNESRKKLYLVGK